MKKEKRVKYLLFLISFSLMVVFGISNVKAATMPVDNYQYFDFMDGNQWFNVPANTTKTGVFLYGIVAEELKSFSYVLTEICATGSISNAYVSNTSLNGYFNEVQVYNTQKTCVVDSQYSGTLYLLQYRVGGWRLDNESTLFVAESYIGFTNNLSYGGVYRFIDIYASDVDIVADEKRTNDFINNVLTQNYLIMTEFDYTQSQIDTIIKEENETQGKLDSIITEENETQQKLDDMQNMDISEQDKQMPDDSKHNEYSEAEGQLKDKVNQADLDNLSIGMDANSSSWVWDTLTRFIQSNSIVFGLFIGLLSIGVIKLALGR